MHIHSHLSCVWNEEKGKSWKAWKQILHYDEKRSWINKFWKESEREKREDEESREKRRKWREEKEWKVSFLKWGGNKLLVSSLFLLFSKEWKTEYITFSSLLEFNPSSYWGKRKKGRKRWKKRRKEYERREKKKYVRKEKAKNPSFVESLSPEFQIKNNQRESKGRKGKDEEKRMKEVKQPFLSIPPSSLFNLPYFSKIIPPEKLISTFLMMGKNTFFSSAFHSYFIFLLLSISSSFHFLILSNMVSQKKLNVWIEEEWKETEMELCAILCPFAKVKNVLFVKSESRKMTCFHEEKKNKVVNFWKNIFWFWSIFLPTFFTCISI